MSSAQDGGRKARVRAAWTPPPGPLPRGDAGDPTLVPGAGETLDMLSGELRIFQRKDGHRFSTDDLLCAWFACDRAAARGLLVRRALDLGTGIGSVAMMVAWKLADAKLTAVEAQDVSAALCARSLRYNALDDRVDLRRGDLREVDVRDAGPFDVVTGSPPYFDERAGVVSDLPQRGPCRFEQRGGVEDYVAAAAREGVLAERGVLALVHLASAAARVAEAAREHALTVATTLPVVLREDKPPHLALYELVRGAAAGAARVAPPLVVRDASGKRTPAFSAARLAMGFPP